MPMRKVTEQAGSKYVVRDARNGRFIEVRGVGALKGRLQLQPDIDLTKPIAAQVEQRDRSQTKR